MHTDAFIDSAFKIDCYEPSQTTQNFEDPQKKQITMRCTQHNKKMRFVCFKEEKAICDYCVTNCSENTHRLVSLKLIRAQANEKALQLKKAKEHYLAKFDQEIENEKEFLLGIIDNECQTAAKRELENGIDKYIQAKLGVIKDFQIHQTIRILEDCQANKEFFITFNAESAFHEDYIVNIFPIWAHKGGKYRRIDDLDPTFQDFIEVRESWKALRQVLDSSLGKFPIAGGLDASSLDFNNTFQESQTLSKIKKEENTDSTIIQKNFDDNLDDSISLFPEVELCKEHKKELHFVCSAEGKVACVDCVIMCNQQMHQILPLEQVRDQAKQMMIYCNNMKEQYHQKWNQLLTNAKIDQKIHFPVEENYQPAHQIEKESLKVPKTSEICQDQMIITIIKISQGYLKLDRTFKKLETGDIDHEFLSHLNNEIKTEIEGDFAKLFLLYEYAKKISNFDKDFQGSVCDWLIAFRDPKQNLSIHPHFEALIDLHYFLTSVDSRTAYKLAVSANKAQDWGLNQALEPDILVKCEIASRITTENQLQITLSSLGFSLNYYLEKSCNQLEWQYFRKCPFEYDWNTERKHQKPNERWRTVHTALEALLSCSNRTLRLIIECDLSQSLPADVSAKTIYGGENNNDDLPKECITAKQLSNENFLLDEHYFSWYGLSDMRNLRQLDLYFGKISRKNLVALSNTVVQPTLYLDSFLLSISSTEVQNYEFANLWHTGLLASIETRKEFELIIEEDIKSPLKILEGLLDYTLPIVSKCQTIRLKLNSVVSVKEDIEELFLKALAFETYFLMTREHHLNYKITQHAQLLADGVASELGLKSDWSVSLNEDKFEENFYKGNDNNKMLVFKTMSNIRTIIKENKWGIRDYLFKVYDPDVIKRFEANLRMRPDTESIIFSIPINVAMQRIDLTKKASAEIVVGSGIAIKGIIES